MLYSDCLQYLYSLGTDVPVEKRGLDNMPALLHALGDPHCRYPSVLIAGTNGKGSTAAFLSSVLSASGRRTGLYTSPHLIKPEERISVNGGLISADSFAGSVSTTIDAVATLGLLPHPTFFEIVTAAACLYFAQSNVDIAVVEAGMGGRTDSTNVLEPVLSVITPVSIDHQVYLGETLEQIAWQKAGIIHARGKALSAPQSPEVRRILEEEAAAKAAALQFVEEAGVQILGSDGGCYQFAWEGLAFVPGLYGHHQVANAVLALSAARALAEAGFSIPESALVAGIGQARIRGRIQKVAERPATFVDGAHNDQALEKLADFVREHTSRPRALVFGMMIDKRISSSVPVLHECFQSIFLTRPRSARAAGQEELAKLFPAGIWVPDPRDALRLARRNMQTVVVAGSLYLAGEVLRAVE